MLPSLLLCLASTSWSAESTYAWYAPPPRVQLESDQTPIAAGHGAIFVPALTDGAAEPKVTLVGQGKVVEFSTGKRTSVAPGRYVLLVGSADPSLSQGVPVEIVEGMTTLTPVAWGALRVEVVDRNMSPHDGPYELVHVDSGQVVELPPRQAKEGVSTWLLAPGLYEIREPGADNQTSPDFLTVYVPASGVATFRLFMDRRSGAFRGGGVIHKDQAITDLVEKELPVAGSVVVGVDGSFVQNQAVPGMANLAILTGGVFLDAEGKVRSDHHALSGSLQARQAQAVTTMDTTAWPMIKTNDNLQGEAKYTFRFNEGTGLYVRGIGRTQLFDTVAIMPTDTTVRVRNQDGSVEERQIGANGSILMAERFSPMTLGAGAGLSASFLNMRNLELTVFGGPGYRSYRYNGVLVNSDNPNTDALEFTRVGSFDQQGLEAGVYANARITGWLGVSSSLDTFFPMGSFGDPNVEWDSSVNLALTDFLSVDYTATVTRVPQISAVPQVQQAAFLRASWRLL